MHPLTNSYLTKSYQHQSLHENKPRFHSFPSHPEPSPSLPLSLSRPTDWFYEKKINSNINGLVLLGQSTVETMVVWHQIDYEGFLQMFLKTNPMKIVQLQAKTIEIVLSQNLLKSFYLHGESTPTVT